MLSPYKIVWQAKSSLDMFCTTELAFDSDSGDSSSFLNKESVFSTIHNGTLRKLHTYKYEDVAKPKFTFIKRDFGDFSRTEHREMLSWLTSSNTAQWLSIYRYQYDEEPMEFYGNFIEVSPYKLANGRTVGYTAVFEASTPWAFTPKIRIQPDPMETDTLTLNISCKSDELNSLIYPKIKFKVLSEGSISIKNETIGIESKILNNQSNEIITLDGDNEILFSERIGGRIFGNDFNLQWFPLKPGDNEITITGKCHIKFEWREPRKIGEY